LADREAESFVARRTDQRDRVVIQVDELLLRHETAMLDALEHTEFDCLSEKVEASAWTNEHGARPFALRQRRERLENDSRVLPRFERTHHKKVAAGQLVAREDTEVRRGGLDDHVDLLRLQTESRYSVILGVFTRTDHSVRT